MSEKEVHYEIHPYYGVPIVHHRSIENLSLGGLPETAVHQVSLKSQLRLDFFARLKRADELFVSLVGAAPPGSIRYPRFQRVESLSNKTSALICLADPTLLLSEEEKFRIGWYSGGAGWDPINEVLGLVRTIMEQIGAKHAAFVGSSAGGFAALRFASFLPKSLAFVADPQTSVGHYYKVPREMYSTECWPGWNPTDVFKAHPERFDMNWLYKHKDPDNFVYYRQSLGDRWHYNNHAKPFANSLDFSQGKRQLIFEDGVRPGHGAITPTEFDFHFRAATEMWRQVR